MDIQEAISHVYQPNVPRGNKLITIGHQYSAQVVYPEKEQPNDPPWVYPLSTRRIPSEETATVGSRSLRDTALSA